MEKLIDKICLTDAINDCCAGDKNCSECDSALRALIKEHDTEVRKKIIDVIEREMYREAFEEDHSEDGLQKWESGNWIRYKLFENVLSKIRNMC